MSQAGPVASRLRSRDWLIGFSVGVCFTLFVAPVFDPLRPQFLDAIFRAVGFTDTAYAADFAWTEFRRISCGDSVDKVESSLGQPLVKYPNYWYSLSYPDLLPRNYVEFCFDKAGKLVQTNVSISDKAFDESIASITSEEDVVKRFGQPKARKHTGPEQEWWYTKSPGSKHYWICIVKIDRIQNTVVSTNSEFYFD